MAIVGRVAGASVHIYLLDHEPPHVHVYYQGQRAKLEIGAGGVTAGSLPPRIAHDVQTWIAHHRAALLVEWRRMRSGQPPQFIP